MQNDLKELEPDYLLRCLNFPLSSVSRRLGDNGNDHIARAPTPPLHPGDVRVSPRRGGTTLQHEQQQPQLPRSRENNKHQQPGSRRDSPQPPPKPQLSRPAPATRPRNPNEPLKQLPEALGLFITALPPGVTRPSSLPPFHLSSPLFSAFVCPVFLPHSSVFGGQLPFVLPPCAGSAKAQCV